MLWTHEAHTLDHIQFVKYDRKYFTKGRSSKTLKLSSLLLKRYECVTLCVVLELAVPLSENVSSRPAPQKRGVNRFTDRRIW